MLGRGVRYWRTLTGYAADGQPERHGLQRESDLRSHTVLLGLLGGELEK